MAEALADSAFREAPAEVVKPAAPVNRHPAISQGFSIFLDHLRWIAALLVVLGHVRQLFFVDFGRAGHVSPLWSLFYVVTRIQHQAVLIFFLLSGAVIAGRFTQWSNWQRFDLRAYALARVTRLWLVLIPVVALCILQLIVTPRADLPANCGISLVRIAGNLLFAQEILVDPLCNNIPLWSLANEFWYYAFAGGVVYAVATPHPARRWTTLAILLLAAGVIAANDQFTEKAVLPYFPFWLLGALAFHPRLPSPPLLPALLLFLGALLAVRLVPLDFYLRDWLFALASFQMLLAARGARPDGWFAAAMRRSAWIAKPLAAQSYSLYLIHYPVCIELLGLVTALHGAARTQPGAFGLLVMAMVLILSYGVAQLLFWLLESRTGNVKGWVEARLGGSPR